MVGLALKGVASLLPKNTIVNKLANNPTSIKAQDIKNALKDVKGSVTGTRGIVGGSSPSVNLLAKVGIKSTPTPNAEQGGLATLSPSPLITASALASQKSVTQSLTAGAMGVSAPTTPNYAEQFVDESNPNGIKVATSSSVTIPPLAIVGGLAVIYFVATNKKRY